MLDRAGYLRQTDLKTLALNIDLITGWFPLTVVIVAVASVVLSVGWLDGAWKWQLPIGIPVSFVLTVLTGVAVAVFNLVPDEFPVTFYLWVWLIWFSLLVIVLRMDQGPLVASDVLGHRFSLLPGGGVHRGQPELRLLPHIGSGSSGKDAANFTDLPGLKVIRTATRRRASSPPTGSTIEVTIPATVSKFQPVRPTCTSPPPGSGAPSPNCRSSR